MQAILQTAGGDEIAWTEGTHYTLTGAGEEEGGTLTVLTIPVDHTPQAGELLVIKRAVPETQLTELPLGGTLPSTTIEQMVDLLTMMVQAHSEEIARAVLLKATSQASGIEIPDPEANRFLRWDDAAQNLENADTVAGGTIGVPVPIGQGGTNATTAAGARQNLGLGDAATRTVGVDAGELLQANQAFVDLPSAGATDIGAASSESVRITGTTAITSFGTATAGLRRRLRFADALALTHNAASLILPGEANITTAANDTAEFISLGAGNWLCLSYKRADGAPVASGAKVVQEVYVEDGTAANTSNNIPIDNTIPQSNEGALALQVAITPQSASNFLIIRALINIGNATAARIVALFKDADADALAVAAEIDTASSFPSTIPLQYRMVAGATSEIVFKVRYGANTGTAWLNGNGAALFGGKFLSSLHIMEVTP